VRTVSATVTFVLFAILHAAYLCSNKAIEHLHHALARECGDEAQGAQSARPAAEGLVAWWAADGGIVRH
jgi:hypothetical protein